MIIYVKPNTQLQPGDNLIANYSTFLQVDVVSEELYGSNILNIDEVQLTRRINEINTRYIGMLWDVASKYQSDNITDLGAVMLMNKVEPNTKAKAVVTWITQLWELYYQKRDIITNHNIGDNLNTTNNEGQAEFFKFTDIGPIPFTFREAMEETL